MGMFYGHNQALPSKIGELGLLYNMYTVLDSRNIAPNGCHVPTWSEIRTLAGYLGGFYIAGGKLKEVGTVHWDSPNSGASDLYSFTAVGGGTRSSSNGEFVFIKQRGVHWTTSLAFTDYYKTMLLEYNSEFIYNYGGIYEAFVVYARAGCSIRCICDTSDTTITDVDGNVYDVITIGTQRWLSKNLKVKKYRNGDNIPNVTSNSSWIGLTTGAWCYYDNDPNNF